MGGYFVFGKCWCLYLIINLLEILIKGKFFIVFVNFLDVNKVD